MEHEGLKALLLEVEAGRIQEARKALLPYLLGEIEAPAPVVYYVLGRSFFGEDNATARYLFEAALAEAPAFEEAGRYEARCGSSLEGLESFEDDRHPPCDTCGLRFREKELCCPYCGMARDTDEHSGESSFESQFRIAKEEMKDSIRTFNEREDVQRAKATAAAVGKHAVEKAKEFAESEKAKELKATAKAFGVVAARRAKKLGERLEVQAAKERASHLGEEAREKAKAFAEREDVKEAVDKAGKTTRTLMGTAQDYVKADQERFNSGDATERAKVVGKWVIILLVVLFVLKWLFGGD
jgi:hypothetical protein